MNLRNRKWAVGLFRTAPLGVALLAVGCGGGGGSATNSSGGAQTTHVGSATITFVGHPQPGITAVTGQVSAAGQAGASYTNISYIPAPNLSSTSLIFSRNLANAGDQVYSMPAVGSNSASLLLHSGVNGVPSISDNGVIAYETILGGNAVVDTILTDGTQQRQVTSGAVGLPTISPNGQTVVYLNGAADLFSIPVTGGTPTEIYSGGKALSGVVFSPTGTQVAFTATNTSTGFANVYTMGATGGALTAVTPTSLASGTLVARSWSPDGLTLACEFTPGGGATSSVENVSLNKGVTFTTTPTGFSDSAPCISPDNLKIAFYRSNVGGATPGIYESDFSGTNPQLVLGDPSNSGITGPVQNMIWTPFFNGQAFIGSGGSMTTSPVAGFLLAQNGSQFASLLTFTATTPSKATIVQSTTNASGGPLIFTLGADSITSILYTNSYYGSHATIFLSFTSTALVSVDAVTGAVDAIAAAIVGKAHPSLTKSSATSVSYSGPFSGIYDRTGKNLAPGGATTVEFDRATGKLTSFR